ncbi:thioredoxin family protein [Prolixibacteraceae bacterium]|nr:thioredoxin family protein [Prolixibacteraceae bacterium]
MEIKVLGTGCTKCKALEKAVIAAVDRTETAAIITKETDIMKIMNYGVMTMPALVINEKVVASGKILSIDQIAKLISNH